jgi:hypothetical protein
MMPLAFLNASGEEGEMAATIIQVLVLIGIVLTWLIGLAMILVGRLLTSQKWRSFCLLVACIECLYVPYGTVLGGFTIAALRRPSVKELFRKDSKAPRGHPS